MFFLCKRPRLGTHGKIFLPVYQLETVKVLLPKTSPIAQLETAKALQVETRVIAPLENVAELPKKTSPTVLHRFVRRGLLETKAIVAAEIAREWPQKTSRIASLPHAKRLLLGINRIVARIPKTCKSTLDFDLHRRCLRVPQVASIFAGVCVDLEMLRLVASTGSSTQLG